MIKKLFLFCCVFNILSATYSQINQNGVPFIRNFTTKEYKAAEQNWAVCMDKRGVVYFGNNDDGVLEFDGVNWNKIPISNNSIVRSLAVDTAGTIYVGAVGEFGYLAPNIKGKMQYNSLLNEELDSLDIGDVWKTYTIEDEVYYCAGKNIVKFKNFELQKVYQDTAGAFISFLVNDHLYIGNYWKGLKELKDDKIQLAKGGEFYQEKDIFVVLPINETELFVGTMEHGHYLYNLQTGESRDISTINKTFHKLSDFLNEALLYNGIRLRNGNLVLTTVSNGCIIINEEGKIINHFSKENGLGDVTVTSAYESENGILWLSLFNSLSYVELNSPFLKFDSHQGIQGMIVDVERFNGTLYIATSLGLYYQYFDENDLPNFGLVQGIEGMVWTLNKFTFTDNKTRLLAGTRLNVYEVINPTKTRNLNLHSLNPKSKEWIDCNVLCQSKIDPNTIFVGNKDGLGSISYVDNQWEVQGTFQGVTDQIITVAQDNDGILWLGTALNGIMRFDLRNDSVKRFGVEKGLPSMDGNKTNFINNDLIISTNKGMYFYEKQKDSIVRYPGFSKIYLTRRDRISNIISQNDSILWIVSQEAVEGASQENFEYVEKIILKDTTVQLIDIPFKRLHKFSFLNVSFDTNGHVWFATTDAAINYNTADQREFTDFYKSLVRQVRIQMDSVTFWGTNYIDTSKMVLSFNQPENLKYSFEYKHNVITFSFSSPYFPVENIRYSYKLEGFEDTWSPWQEKTEKDYTNLREGKYTFMVKAQNIYGIESDVAAYEFTILPPWYKTVVAYVVYFILAVLLIVVIVKIYTRRLELEKIRLEQIVKERTEEVVKQKEEIEKQRDEIAEKNRSITDSIEYASRIQNAVLPSGEYALDILPEHFILFRPRDIVSGDFYWMTKKDNLLVLIAADCTGHGVPGAFMSMLGVSFLNEIVNRHEITTASAILNQLRADVKKTLGQEGKEGEAKDGMDLALCIVDPDKMKLQYAGAYNPLYLFRNEELIEVKADRMPIGIYIKEKESFTNHEMDLQKGDVFYIFSDGFQDQFGGEDGSKFKTKNFKQLLLEIHHKPMTEQRKILDTKIDQWRGHWEQVDDIIIMGVRI
ncbi:MAG: SpoIIE family protein phosphatase [Bacteroidales bacterium]|jgi:serine phosphatase RsbU (regulator of sigma subunit)/ligand-binding sensor domain-containing protein|nr:SpoIIE family protein phosphatase [Bacteroidales bacterium]